MKTKLAVLAVAFALAGCAYETPIQRYSDSTSKFRPPPVLMSNNVPQKDIYRFFMQGATGFVPISSCVREAEEKAEKFCSRQGKNMLLLGSKTSKPPYILGNFPRVEVIFAVVDKH